MKKPRNKIKKNQARGSKITFGTYTKLKAVMLRKKGTSRKKAIFEMFSGPPPQPSGPKTPKGKAKR